VSGIWPKGFLLAAPDESFLKGGRVLFLGPIFN